MQQNSENNNDNNVVAALKKFGRAAWAYIKHARIELIVAAALLVLDLVSKALVAHNMFEGQSIQLIPNFIYFTYVRNTKAAFGSAFGLEKIMSDNAIRIIFLVVTVLAVGVFCWLLYRCRKRHILMRVSLAMIIAGAIGNFIDRLVLHYVRDFVEIVFFGCDLPLLGTSFAIFNIADVGLTVGVLLFLVYFIIIYKEPKKAQNTAQESAAPAADGQSESQKGDSTAQICPEEHPAPESVQINAVQEKTVEGSTAQEKTQEKETDDTPEESEHGAE